MTINPNPTPGGYPFAHNDLDGTKPIRQQLAETEETLDLIKGLLDKLRAQLGLLSDSQKD